MIGQSTRDAGEPLDRPVRIPDLVGTVLRTVFDGGQLRLRSDVPNGILRMRRSRTASSAREEP